MHQDVAIASQFALDHSNEIRVYIFLTPLLARLASNIYRSHLDAIRRKPVDRGAGLDRETLGREIGKVSFGGRKWNPVSRLIGRNVDVGDRPRR